MRWYAESRFFITMLAIRTELVNNKVHETETSNELMIVSFCHNNIIPLPIEVYVGRNFEYLSTHP